MAEPTIIAPARTRKWTNYRVADSDTRFWEKVHVRGPDECWEWQARRYPNGYGACNDKRFQTHYSHRIAYILKHGPIPDGLVIDHLCRNRACCNPKHLEAVTQRENLGRGENGVLKTHCPQGHPYDAENTIHRFGRKRGRECRKCNNERALKRYWKQKNERIGNL